MTHADPEREASAGEFRDRLRRCCHRNCITRPDIRDPGCDGETLGVVQQIRRMCKRFATDRLRDPECFVARLLDCLGKLGACRRRHCVKEKPNAYFTDIHRASSQTSSWLTSNTIHWGRQLPNPQGKPFPL